jgi:hypothetical protein
MLFRFRRLNLKQRCVALFCQVCLMIVGTLGASAVDTSFGEADADALAAPPPPPSPAPAPPSPAPPPKPPPRFAPYTEAVVLGVRG